MKIGNREIADTQLIHYGYLAAIAISAVLTVSCLAGLITRCTSHSRADGLLEKYSSFSPAAVKPDQSSSAQSNAASSSAAKSKQEQLAEQVSQRGMFSPPNGKKQFAGKLIGVLGDSVIFQDNQCVKCGEKYQDATIKQIGPDWVDIEHNGTTVRLSLFASDSPQPAGPGMMPPGRSGPSAAATPDQPSNAGAGRMGRFANFRVTPEMIDRLRNMPQERRDRMLSRVPPEIRQQLKDQGIE